MSKLFFEEEYIVVIPSYNTVCAHKHNFLHLFLLSSGCDTNPYSQVIIIDKNVIHQIPELDKCRFILLIDPTSFLAESIKKKYLINNDKIICDVKINISEYLVNCKSSELNGIIKNLLSDMDVLQKENDDLKDSRVIELIREIKNQKYFENNLKEIAKSHYISVSRMSHIFKEQTGISLKGYINMKKLEKAYQLILSGYSSMEAALEVGFSSASHLAAFCKKNTGISISEVLR